MLCAIRLWSSDRLGRVSGRSARCGAPTCCIIGAFLLTVIRLRDRCPHPDLCTEFTFQFGNIIRAWAAFLRKRCWGKTEGGESDSSAE